MNQLHMNVPLINLSMITIQFSRDVVIICQLKNILAHNMILLSINVSVVLIHGKLTVLVDVFKKSIVSKDNTFNLQNVIGP